MKRVLKTWARGACPMVVVCVAAGGAARAADVYALTVQGALIRFDTSTPGLVTTIGSVGGASGDAGRYAGIDFRPATGGLYLVEIDSAGPSRLYTLSLADASATSASTMSVALSGGRFGVDFNPVPDRLRTTSDTGQNLRTNVDTGGVTVDGALAYAAGDANAGVSPMIVASAYTNSRFGAIGGTTTLYNFDAATGNLVTQNPPNAGTLNTIGSVGVGLGGEAGFDIFFNGSLNTAYAALSSASGAGSDFYRIDLATGAATLIGAIGGGVAVRDISVIPAPATCGLLGLGVLAAHRRRR